MGKTIDEIFGMVICEKFYVEKQSKAAIAREMRLSRNTVKKYLKLKSHEVAPRIDTNAQENIPSPVKNSSTSASSHLGLQKVLSKVINEGDGELKDLDLINTINEMADYLGINCRGDFLRLEMAIESYIMYRMAMSRTNFLNGQLLDVSWLENADKISKILARFSVSATNHIKIFENIVKELEMKYNRRFPVISRVQNLNIQKNEINLSSNSLQNLQETTM